MKDRPSKDSSEKTERHGLKTAPLPVLSKKLFKVGTYRINCYIWASSAIRAREGPHTDAIFINNGKTVRPLLLAFQHSNYTLPDS